jgi:hypothetical protein
MAIKVPITLSAPDDALRDFAAGALLRVERAASEDGSYAELGTVAIVAATVAYEYFDSTGAATSWYRWRVSNAAGSLTSGYSDPYQGVDAGQHDLPSGSYATVDALMISRRQTTNDGRVIAAAEKHLRDTTRDLEREIKYSFFRRPQTGTEARLYHGSGSRRLHIHEGIAQLDLVEIRLTAGGSWVELSADDWYLESYPCELNPLPDEPYFHVVLAASGTYRVFPRIERGVRLTIATGWPRPPQDAVAANIAWARQRLALDASLPGGPIGPEELGYPSAPDRKPQAVYDLIAAERQRHMACSM